MIQTGFLARNCPSSDPLLPSLLFNHSERAGPAERLLAFALLQHPSEAHHTLEVLPRRSYPCSAASLVAPLVSPSAVISIRQGCNNLRPTFSHLPDGHQQMMCVENLILTKETNRTATQETIVSRLRFMYVSRGTFPGGKAHLQQTYSSNS